jgi:hypothetical protein
MKESDLLKLKLHSALAQLIELSAENSTLKEENSLLKKILAEQLLLPVNPPPVEKNSGTPNVLLGETSLLSKAEKIVLFRSIFRGREDIYPIRWENAQSAKSGYSPAIRNKWEYIEAKKQGDKNVIPQYLALTDEVIQQHLEGKIVVGVYPLLTDDTCWFLAVDFDEASYEDDAKSFATTCREFGIDAYIERSRSCKGAHVWIFFDQPISATLARQLGFTILTQTMERTQQIALKSYDRFFPNQDTLPKGGFGNLIALPLQREARKRGGSVFVGDAFTPLQDQCKRRLKRVIVQRVKIPVF